MPALSPAQPRRTSTPRPEPPVLPGTAPPPTAPSATSRRLKFLDRLSKALRPRQLSRRAEYGYYQGVKGFDFFHNIQHRNETGGRLPYFWLQRTMGLRCSLIGR